MEHQDPIQDIQNRQEAADADLIPAATPPEMRPPSTAAIPKVRPTDCSTCSAEDPQLVYALGLLDYDYGTEARRDSFLQHGINNPHDPETVLAHLEDHPAHASALTWTLVQDATPIYAIMPLGPFGAEAYATLREFLNEQITGAVERVSVPGWLQSPVQLMNGQLVPVIAPELRGMYSWSTHALVQAVVGDVLDDDEAKAMHAEKVAEISNHLERVYYEIRNLGLLAQERAMNYAATNAFQLNEVFTTALKEGTKLDSIGVERSPICRPESDCWDVKLTFFNPMKRQEEARKIYRFTIDVSDVVPVTVGPIRHWYVY